MTDEEIIKEQNSYYMAGYSSRRSENKVDGDEIKNKISMALKDPILQQGFEVICRDLAISEHDREHNDYELTELYKKVEQLEKENAELKSIADFQTSGNMDRHFQLKRNKEHITKAKEIIEGLIDSLETVDGEQVRELTIVKEAEQFLKEVKE